MLQAEVLLKKVQATAHLIEQVLGADLKDIVPAYGSIALFTDLSIEDVKHELSSSDVVVNEDALSHKKLRLPVCYEFGLDLEAVAAHNQLTVEEIIDQHLKGEYEAALIGFTPGFIYLDGLHEQLACPRRSNPRVRVEAGSVGIGGAQTGIYSLTSPGGWNIIGRTPLQLFDMTKTPPMNIEVGVRVQFYRISEDEFQEWES